MTSRPITEPNRHSVYTGRTTNWPMVVLTFFGALLVVLLGSESNGAWTDLAFVVPALLIVTLVITNALSATSVRATAGPNGLTVHWGLIGWPSCTYRLDEIEHAQAIDLPWWRVSFGLWWTPKRTSCTVRSGPAVRLSLRNGRIVTITIPDPSAAIAALDAASGSPTE